MEFAIQSFLRGVILPAFVTGTILLAAWLVRRRIGASSIWVFPLAMGAGFIAGFLALDGVPKLPPAEDWKWLVYLSVLAVPAGIVESITHTPAWIRWGIAVALACVAAWVLVPRWASLADVWSIWVVGLAAAIAVTGTALPNVARKIDPRLTCGSLALVSGALSGTLMIGNNAVFAQITGALAACWAMAFLVSCCCASNCRPAGAAPLAAVLLPGLAANGHFHNYSDVPFACFVLCGLAPLALVAGLLAPVRRLGGWRTMLCQLALVTIPCGIAIMLAVTASSGDSGDGSYY